MRGVKAKAAPAFKRPRLTLAQLAAYDDILTDALVDQVFYWTIVPKNRPSYHPSRGIRGEEIAKIIQEEIINKNVEAAEARLLNCDGLQRFLNSLKTDREKTDFQRHLRRYLQIYLPDCAWEVNSTNRYTIVTHEASVCARRPIKRNETIKYLCGIQVNITPEEEKEISTRKKVFSIVVSTRNKCTSLFMGPARFANHDCGANAKLITTDQSGIEIIATRHINTGEEITVSYGENYFGEDNCECLCQTCETKLCNRWKPDTDMGQTSLAPDVKPSVEENECRGFIYALRQRPRDDSVGATSSRTPSVTLGIRPRVFKFRGKACSLSPAVSSLSDASPVHEKRPLDAYVTSPITPAKRLKYVDLTRPAAEARAMSRDSVSSGSASSSGVEICETDGTSPERESPMMSANEPKIVPIGVSSLARNIKDEDCVVLPAVSPRAKASLLGAAASKACASPAADTKHSLTEAHGTVEIDGSNCPTSKAELAIAESIEVADEAQAITSAEVGPPVRRRKYQRRVFIKQTTPPARSRSAKDYVLTSRLLSEPEMAWVQCTNCSAYFVQQNAYYTRCSCPRCERHSKLYGYVWPITVSDKEERVLDHRTVHRFLNFHDELRARGWKGPPTLERAEQVACSVPSPLKRKTQKINRSRKPEGQSESNEGHPRRSGRWRRASSKLT